MRERTQVIIADLVDFDEDYLEQAYEFWKTTNRTPRLTVVDKRVVGINTGTLVGISEQKPIKTQRQLTHQPTPETVPEAVTDRKSINEAMVIAAFDQLGPTSAMYISDHLGIDRKDNSLRTKVSHVIAKLRGDGKLIQIKKTTPGMGFDYRLRAGKKKVTASKPLPTSARKQTDLFATDKVVPRTDNPSKDAIIELLKIGEPMLSMTIGDHLGYSRKDSGHRIKVTSVLNSLLKDNLIVKVGTVNGIMPLYQWIEITETAAETVE
jgi:hypothetical protein